MIIVQYPFKAANNITLPSLEIGCRRFNRSPNDILSDVWEAEDGETMVIEFPPYACVSSHL